MKSFSRLAAFAALSLVYACSGGNTSIEGIVADAPSSSVVLKRLDNSRSTVLDTIKTGERGEFRYSLDLSEPEFLYLYYGERQIASLLLDAGDKVKVETDTLGAYRISGSEECLRLQKVENSYNAFIRDLSRIIASEKEPDRAVSRRYVEYYRDRVNYVMANSHSLSVVPVFFQKVNRDLDVFSNKGDGFIMEAIADSLEAVYPKSRYVKALRNEASRRINLLELTSKLETADEIGYVDIELPGIDGKKIRLSDVEHKLTMIYFWSSDAVQKMFNISSLLPVYEEFQGKGFEIYAVSLDVDKSRWAAAVKNQKLPWVNVCDTRGVASPYLGSYAVTSLPMMWMVRDGVLDPISYISSMEDLRKYLSKYLQ